jgi:pyridoxal-phosphate dependent enzyme
VRPASSVTVRVNPSVAFIDDAELFLRDDDRHSPFVHLDAVCRLPDESLPFETRVPIHDDGNRWRQFLRAVRDSGGTAVSVSEHGMMRACEELTAKEGLFVAPEGGASIAALKKLRQSGFLAKADRILIYNTGSGYKYLEAWKQYLNEA